MPSHAVMRRLPRCPATTLLLLCIIYYAYHIWANRLTGEHVAFSYNLVSLTHTHTHTHTHPGPRVWVMSLLAGLHVSNTHTHTQVVCDGEYWRVWTASFAHLDLLHLAFNCMSLWALAGA
jgi:membrane associated rhomboid family serine protease